MKCLTYDSIKRVGDVVVSVAGLLFTAPLQVGIAVIVRTKLGTPVLFRQKRPGKDGRIFTLVKFRTMLHPDPGRGPVSDADRLTRFGAFLRSTSLDELPTLWNVLRGDMSLVGPRPLLAEYLPLYDARQARRHEVRPGITGLAQVSGRNAVDWPERLELDVQYVERRGLRLDAVVLGLTLGAVLKRTGISDGATLTMTPFTGHAAGRVSSWAPAD